MHDCTLPRERHPEPWLAILLAVAALLFFVLASKGADPAQAKYAVVRVPSHGASATVVDTAPGRTLILGCAHAFRGADRAKPIVLDIPWPGAGGPKAAASHLVAVDYDLDLSLVEVADGPWPYVAPIAYRSWRPTHPVLSIGYDEMKMPPQCRPTTILNDDGQAWHTRERPWHGRSGGGLIDPETGYLVGVCSGYTGPRNHLEIFAGAEGIYVSHQAIVRFVTGGRGAPADDFRGRPVPPAAQRWQSPAQPLAPAAPCPRGG